MKINKFKLFISVIFCIIIIFCLKCNVFADSELVDTLPNFDDLLNDGDYWFIYLNPSRTRYVLVISDVPGEYTGHYFFSKFYPDTNEAVETIYSDSLTYIHFLRRNYFKRYFLDIQNPNSWVLYDTYTVNDPNYSVSSSSDFSDSICASNYDLKNHNFLGNNDVVFRCSPTLSTLKGTHFKVAMGDILKETTGILPIILIVLVSLIAIRKAIAFLRTLLRRS